MSKRTVKQHYVYKPVNLQESVNPVVTWESDWERLPARHPVVGCPRCGGVRRATSGPHALRWVDGRRVDCGGEEAP